MFELVMVIVIISIVAAASLKYYIDVREEALLTSFETQSSRFAAVVYTARAEWFLQGHSAEVPTQPGDKMSVNLDGEIVFVNEYGWPANTSPELDSSLDTQTAAECYELWIGLMSKPVPATVEGLTGSSGNKGDQQYHISRENDVCRFTLTAQLEDDYFFEYNLKTGKVLTNQLKIE